MLYYKFQNYEEFKNMFGIIKHGNGYAAEKEQDTAGICERQEIIT